MGNCLRCGSVCGEWDDYCPTCEEFYRQADDEAESRLLEIEREADHDEDTCRCLHCRVNREDC